MGPSIHSTVILSGTLVLSSPLLAPPHWLHHKPGPWVPEGCSHHPQTRQAEEQVGHLSVPSP